MNYFQARSDLQFILEFRDAVLELWELEEQARERLKDRGISGYRRGLHIDERQRRLQQEATKLEGYQEVRERVARKILRANRISLSLGVPTIITSYPMPALAGSAPVIRLSCYEAIIRDTSYVGVDRQTIYDILTKPLPAGSR
jgi:hypothetical protein